MGWTFGLKETVLAELSFTVKAVLTVVEMEELELLKLEGEVEEEVEEEAEEEAEEGESEVASFSVVSCL